MEPNEVTINAEMEPSKYVRTLSLTDGRDFPAGAWRKSNQAG